MRNYRTFAALEEGYLRDHPDEVDDYITILEEREELRAVQLENLRKQLKAGIDSGQGISSDKVFGRLETKYQAADSS